MKLLTTQAPNLLFKRLAPSISAKFRPVRLTAAVVSIALVTQLTACGTLFYPERKGQTQGRLDPGIVALDGVGLLLFIIPGLIAFGVDFYHGTIYLPGGKSASLTPDELNSLQKNKQVDESALKNMVNAKFDLNVSQSQELTQMSFKSVNALAEAVQLANNQHNFASR